MNTLITKMPWFSRTFRRPQAAIIGVACLALALLSGLIALIAWGLSGGISGSANPNEVVNTAGHYRFDVPAGWSHAEDGRTTTVTSPDKATVVTLGVGGIGAIPMAGTAFFQEVASHYKNVQLLPPEAKKIGSRPALFYGGVGDNDQNTSIRFLAITVENKPTNYSIAVFTAADSDPKTVLPPVNQLVESFQPTS
ncbi:MAG TPA: hypothetical protein VFO16_00180 [Pseudonocardiaceae bacterium]|nr:hypothetical protein [Pseudonocardiaceae bacterium]